MQIEVWGDAQALSSASAQCLRTPSTQITSDGTKIDKYRETNQAKSTQKGHSQTGSASECVGVCAREDESE